MLESGLEQHKMGQCLVCCLEQLLAHRRNLVATVAVPVRRWRALGAVDSEAGVGWRGAAGGKQHDTGHKKTSFFMVGWAR